MLKDPGLVAVVAYDGLCAFEFGVAAEVFGLPRPEFAFPWYRFAVAGVEPGPYRALGGLTVNADGRLELLAAASTIVIPGWRGRDTPAPAAFLDAITDAYGRGARIITLCSGVFALAETGLLNGRQATTHSRYIEELRRRHPRVSVVENVLYVDEDAMITAAGSAAGIDACLHLVRRDFGATIANTVARRLVLAGHREGDRPQSIPRPGPKPRRDGFEEALDYARGHLDQPLSVPQLAHVAAMSERTFLRRFHERIGLSPKAWLNGERIGRAQELLETGVHSLEDVAAATGFASGESFRAAFRKVVGVAPGSYRTMHRFSPRAA